jgi:1-acyl-sn-glycerol-3-phosphate acyltransferase
MANHQSNCDPPALLAVVPRVLVLVKKEFFRVPILGRGMVACGFIPVDRRNREQALGAVEKGVQALKAGRSFLVYPEGTRSPDGRLQPFKKGVFVMAIKAGAPIVPISVSGSNKIMPKGKFVIRPGRVRITFHEPVATEGLAMEDRQAIIERVRQAVLAGLEKDEWPKSSDK